MIVLINVTNLRHVSYGVTPPHSLSGKPLPPGVVAEFDFLPRLRAIMQEPRAPVDTTLPARV